MAQGIRWKIPAGVLADSGSYTIQVYRSTSSEDGDYALIDTISAGSGNTLRIYTDTGGSISFWYYVVYVSAQNVIGDRVLAVSSPTIREQRVAEQIYSHMPEIVRARLDADYIDIRKAMKNALDTVNAFTPATGYVFSNMPDRFETAIVILSMTLLFIEKHLQIAIRDYSYSGTGISLTIDRSTKFATTIAALTKQVNELLAFVKHGDWADPIGLGTDAIGTPQGRIFSFLFGGSSF